VKPFAMRVFSAWFCPPPSLFAIPRCGLRRRRQLCRQIQSLLRLFWCMSLRGCGVRYSPRSFSRSPISVSLMIYGLPFVFSFISVGVSASVRQKQFIPSPTLSLALYLVQDWRYYYLNPFESQEKVGPAKYYSPRG